MSKSISAELLQSNTPFRPFLIDRFFSKYYYNTKYILCAAASDPMRSQDLLSMASLQTKHEWDNMELKYQIQAGNVRLRECVANLYNDYYKNNILNDTVRLSKATKDNILITVPQEAILIAMHCILSKGDDIIVLAPLYQSLYEHAIQIKCNIHYWSFEYDTHKTEWVLDIEKLRDIISKTNSKLLVVNFPHNPTGYIPSIEDYMEMIDLCKKNNIWLFSDEMYWFLWPDKCRNNCLPSAFMMYDKAITLCGMSKTFGMPGVRIGWLITLDNALFHVFAQKKDYTTICSPLPCELLSIMALENHNYNKIINKTVDLITENRQNLYDFIDKNSDLFEWTLGRNTPFNNSYAGQLCFIRLIGKAAEIGAHQFCITMINKCGVLLLPSTCYEYDSDVARLHFVRIGIGRRNVKEALFVLDRYLLTWRREIKAKQGVLIRSKM